MNSQNEETHVITDEENAEPQEIEDLEHGGSVNVIPFHVIKIPRETQASPPQFATLVRGKYSKYYKQTYRPAWEQMPDFKGWLKGVDGEPTRAYCTYCQKTLHAHRLSLLKHTCTIRHQKAAQIHSSQKGRSGSNRNMESNDIQTVIVSEEILEEDDDDIEDQLEPQVVYTTQEEMDEQDLDTENDQDDDEDEEERDSASVKAQHNSGANNSSVSLPPISTHVVDTTRGVSVTGLSVSLYKLVDGRWTYINEGLTDTFGRMTNFIKRPHFLPGRYKLHYDVDRYFEARKQKSLYPFIEIVFDSSGFSERYHFPLLLSPNSYTTYRSMHVE